MAIWIVGLANATLYLNVFGHVVSWMGLAPASDLRHRGGLTTFCVN